MSFLGLLIVYCVLSCLYFSSSVIMGDPMGPDLTWVEEEPCDRGLSRQVRQFVEKNVYSKLDMPPNHLPSNCQLHPDQDIYADQEKHKKEESRMDWKCSYCGKHFKTEFYLDKHMHNKHEDKLTKGSGNMCLASLCPIFGCRDSLSVSGAYRQHQKYQKRATSNGKISPNKLQSEKNFDLDAVCTNAEVEKSKYQCEVLVRRCFGFSDELTNLFEEEICEKLHCEDGVLRGSIIGTKNAVNNWGGSDLDSDNHNSSYEHSDGHGSRFIRKLFLILALLVIFSYMTFFIFCGSSLKSTIPAYFGSGKYSTAGLGKKGSFREAQASAGVLGSAARLLGPRKRHIS